ncbi:MAG: hypothetical protein GEV03_07900 [Streptosporangiales bacterium]|nr:hypothetical protein [Streptosporangiales bacterium]
MKATVGSSRFFGYVRHSLSLAHNPLRRTSDQLEGAARLATIVLLVLLAPFGALHVGQKVYGAGVQVERGQAVDHRPVRATLLEDVSMTNAMQSDLGVPQRTTPARWVAQDGTVRKGAVSAPPGKRAGARVTIWLDRTGQPTIPPQTRSHTLTEAVAAGVGIVLATALGLQLVSLLVRLVLDRRRLARWDLEWKLFEPRWSGRR